MNALRVLPFKQARILAYHSISTERVDPWTVSPQQLEAHLQYLHDHHFKVCSLSELVNRLECCENVTRCVCLTFDDGFVDFRSTTLPILQEWDVPATVYIVTGKVNGRSDWSHYASQRPLMSLHDLEMIATAPIEITVGSHSVTHQRLSMLSAEQVRNELTTSLDWLKKHLSVIEAHLAYPYGDCTPQVIQAVQAAGYRSAAIFGGLWGNNAFSSRWMLTREPMLAEHTIADFAAILCGKRDWQELWFSFRRKLHKNLQVSNTTLQR